LIPQSLREQRDADYWGRLVAQALYECVGKDDDALKTSYLTIMDQFPLSRMHFYMCLRGGNSSIGRVDHIPEEILLALDEKGLHILDGTYTLPSLFSLRYTDIRRFAIKTNSIRFTLEPIDASPSPYDLELITPLCDEISVFCLLFRPLQVQQGEEGKRSSTPPRGANVSSSVYYINLLSYHY
jgi:hypothetical protein